MATTVYAVKATTASLGDVFASVQSGDIYTYGTGPEKHLYLDTEADTVVSHMNSTFSLYSWEKESDSYTLNQTPGVIGTPQVYQDPQFNCVKHKCINNVLMYRKSDGNLSDVLGDGEVLQYTRTQIKTEQNAGWSITKTGRV